MKLLVLSVANRAPAWVEEGWHDYARRMPRETPLSLLEVKPEPRSGGKSSEAMMAAEARRLDAALAGSTWHRVVLDEAGDAPDTRQLAARLEKWQATGNPVALIIGGPDGLDASFKAAAQERLRLSSLTLPHALVRVLLAEALYRASSLLRGHPYHRE